MTARIRPNRLRRLTILQPGLEAEVKGIDLGEEVPESRDYQLLYELDLSKLGPNIAYDIDRKDSIKGYPHRIDLTYRANG